MKKDKENKGEVDKSKSKPVVRHTVLTDEEYKAMGKALQYIRVNGPASYKDGAMDALEELYGREQVARS